MSNLNEIWIGWGQTRTILYSVVVQLNQIKPIKINQNSPQLGYLLAILLVTKHIPTLHDWFLEQQMQLHLAGSGRLNSWISLGGLFNRYTLCFRYASSEGTTHYMAATHKWHFQFSTVIYKCMCQQHDLRIDEIEPLWRAIYRQTGRTSMTCVAIWKGMLHFIW